MTTTGDHVRPLLDAPTRRRRWFATMAGVLFSAALFASLVVGTAPDIHDSAAETLAHYSDETNKTKALIAWGLAVIAVLALMWFLAELVRHLRTKGGSDGSALPVVIAGSALVATLIVASAVRAAPVGDLVLDSEERAGSSGKLTPAFADFAQITSSLYDWLAFFGVGLAAATLVLCVSLGARSPRTIPRWLEWAGYAAVPVLAFVAFLNLIVLMIWVIAVGIVIARAPEPVLASTAAVEADA